MKVGLVCPYNIFKGGGVQECVLAMQTELKNRGHHALIITPNPREYDEDTEERNDDIVLVGGSTNVKSFHTTAQIAVSVDMTAIEALLDHERFDILHFHEPWVPILSRQILTRSNSINIATFHAKLPETMMHRTIERVVTPYTKSVLKYLDSFTAVSDAAADYVKTLTDKPIEIIPNGIDITKYSVRPHRPRKKKRILFVGRLEKRKGVKYLLEAFSLVVKTHPEVELVIVGEGPEREKLEGMVASDNIPNVTFHGFVDEKTKLKLLGSADVFCSPALYGESFGIVLLEAMAAGVPIVAGNNPGYVSVLKERGMVSIVPPKETSQFARRLEIMLFDEAIRKAWLKWAEKYVKEFTYGKVVDKYERLYESVCRDNGVVVR